VPELQILTSGLAGHKWNDVVVDGRGNAYVNNVGFDFPGGEFAPGIVAVAAPDDGERAGQVLTAQAPAPRAGWP
jgi:hypothetical protein